MVEFSVMTYSVIFFHLAYFFSCLYATGPTKSGRFGDSDRLVIVSLTLGFPAG